MNVILNIMNNNHFYRPTLTGNKNRHKVNADNLGHILKVQSNKKQNSSHFPGISKIQNSIFLLESQIFELSQNFDHNSVVDVRQFKEQSDSRQRVKTEIVRPKYQLQLQSQKVDYPTAYFPKLKDRAQSYQKKKYEKIAPEVDLSESPVSIRDLQKSLDYSRSISNKQKRNLTPLQQRTIEVSKIISQSDHLNQEEIMQFSFGLQYNRINIEKQKSKFPKDIFLGNVRKVKRIFQQQ
ncbi:unnamed protein product [Paramecium sonneborni]|uniref:Uncharacterized protein n=1 Tax=Paramecium sonneborni TaxID=65129 RepID=A0A8S1M1H5_9CILI|nr:unnamed protein product [Paramecium sonneborni]